MPLQKLQLRPGLYREGTIYSNSGGWFDGDKIRFRSGLPEKIGGWARISTNTFLGVCRSLWNWTTLSGDNLLGVGTNLKYYIEKGGVYNDITPITTVASFSNVISTGFTTLVANITGNDPLTLLSFIQGKTKLEANAIMIYYLNSLKSKSSLYGITVLPQPNDNVQRNIVL